MMEIIEYDKTKLQKIIERSENDISQVSDIISDILNNVKINGDDALREYTEKFDKVLLDDFKVSKDEIQEAYNELDDDLIDSIKKAKNNIARFHQSQLPDDWSLDVDDGIVAGQIIRPIPSVGCYIPGGRAAYPSTILMTVIPAKIAGVDKIVCCTPPQSDGKILAAILVAADIAGADEIYKVGGAQAIAALAYGTQSIPKVSKIVGPGNIFVTGAKQQVYGSVDVEFPAGPSEVLVLADNSANPELIAYDLLAQSEHDPNAPCILVSSSEEIAHKVYDIVEENIEKMERRDIIRESLGKYGKIVITKDEQEAIMVTNEYAAEHLIIMTRNPRETLKEINNAGSIFLGQLTPVAAGDYGAGTNHVLPTAGGAKMYSGLSTESFLKKPTVLELDKEGLDNLRDVVIPLAEYEGLYAHAESFKKRL